MNQPEDVEVILAYDRRYKFHANVLARTSTLFARLLTEPSAAKLSNKAIRAGIKTRWMIQLTALPTAENPAGTLDLIKLDSMGQAIDGRTGMVINENGRVPTKIFEYYEAVFYALYNKEISVSDDDMRTALQDAVEIVRIAEYLGCVSVISKPVDVALVKHGQTFFRAIQQMPWSWISLGFRLKSELIFKEALIHLAGNWRRIKEDPNKMARMKEVPASVREQCERMHKALIRKGQHLEHLLISCYPAGMCQPSNQLPIKREHYGREILVWMALCFFRHWLGQRIITGKGSQGPDGGYELYCQISEAGEAYMDKSIVTQFHSKVPMTKKALNVLENHLLEIKECMKGQVEEQGILKSTCQLDIHRYRVDYLTCVEVVKEDFPWLQKDGSTAAAGQKRKAGTRPGGNEIVQQNLAAAERFATTDDFRVEVDEDESERLEQGRSKRVHYAEASGFHTPGRSNPGA